jgi:hypothetical protein
MATELRDRPMGRHDDADGDGAQSFGEHDDPEPAAGGLRAQMS